MNVLVAGSIFATLSLAAFAAYAWDKQKARHGAWRTPEKALLSLGFVGGALGALLAMYFLRHKTQHWYFWVVNIFGLAWQALVLIYLLMH